MKGYCDDNQTVKPFVVKCEVCNQPIRGQYLYEVKLDDGQIVVSHGNGCLDKLAEKIKRIPMKSDPLVTAVEGSDWWVRKIGQTCPYCGTIIRETPLYGRENP